MERLRTHWPQLTTLVWGSAKNFHKSLQLGGSEEDVMHVRDVRGEMDILSLLIANRLLTCQSRRVAAYGQGSARSDTGRGREQALEFEQIQSELSVPRGGDGSPTRTALAEFSEGVESDVERVYLRALGKCKDDSLSRQDGSAARVWLWLGLVEAGCFQCLANQSALLRNPSAMRSLAKLLDGLYRTHAGGAGSSVPVDDQGLRVNDGSGAHVDADLDKCSRQSFVEEGDENGDGDDKGRRAGSGGGSSSTTPLSRRVTSQPLPGMSADLRLTDRMHCTFPDLYAAADYRPSHIAAAFAAEAEDASPKGDVSAEAALNLLGGSARRVRAEEGISVGFGEVWMAVLRVLATITHDNGLAPGVLREDVMGVCVLSLETLMRQCMGVGVGAPDDGGTSASTAGLESLFFLLTILTNLAEMDATICRELSARLGGPVLKLLLKETRSIMSDIVETDDEPNALDLSEAKREQREDRSALMDRVPVGEIILSAHCSLLLYTFSREHNDLGAADFLTLLPRQSWWLCVRMLKALISLQGRTGVMVVDSVLPVLQVIATMEQEDQARVAGVVH